ncbi:hypothetical protein FACS189459_5050 [Bacilli bacterium]|nr:hypothetical protein FACS189459_5050 [Bacilli bacterium]
MTTLLILVSLIVPSKKYNNHENTNIPKNEIPATINDLLKSVVCPLESIFPCIGVE